MDNLPFLKTGGIRDAIQSEVKELLPDGLGRFDHLRVTAEKIYPNKEPTITWNDQAVASPGNITGISAPPKAGKTAVMSVLAAGAISPNGNVDGFSAIRVAPNPNGKAVIVMDTEQSEYDQQYNLKTTLKRSGFEFTPKFFCCYNIRGLKMSEYRDKTDGICEAAASEFKGIHAIFIDGGADYIRSANDEEKSAEIIEYFTHLAIRFDCCVIIVVHTNPGSEKERGHFGSYLQRKCYGILTIESDKGLSTLKGKATRKAGEFDPIKFQYDSEKGYHIEVGASDSFEDIEAKKNIKQIAKVRSSLLRSLAPSEKYQHNQAVKLIMKTCLISSDKTAKEYLKTGVIHEFIVHENELYYLNPDQGNSG